MFRFLLLNRKNYFNSLFSYIRIKDHFSLISPIVIVCRSLTSFSGVWSTLSTRVKREESSANKCISEDMSSYPTQLVLFKVQNDLVAKNISDQNFTIDGKQFKIREYLETSFRCTRCLELCSHLSKDCSNPKKCVRCAGPDCEIRNCKKGTLLCSNCGGGHSAAHKSCPALKAKNQNLFHQKQQKISR